MRQGALLVFGFLLWTAGCGAPKGTDDSGLEVGDVATETLTVSGSGTGTGTGTGTAGTGTGATGATTGPGTGTGSGTGTGTGSATAAACGEEVDLQMGVGLTGFEPLVDDDAIVLVFGGQGGRHFDAAGSVMGSSPIVLVSYTVYSPDLDAIIGGDGAPAWSLALASYDADNCTGVFFGEQARLQEAVPEGFATMQEFVCSLSGRDVVVTYAVEDLYTGARTSASATVEVVLDPLDEVECT